MTVEKPHHSGHRDRLRERFIDAPEALPDYELLELLLFLAIPRRDVKPIAKDLIAKFKDLNGVLRASPEELEQVKGVSRNTAIALRTVQAAGLRVLRQNVMKQPVLNSWSKLIDYLTASMSEESREHFRLLFLNKKNELIADELQGSGMVDHTPAYPREIMKRALEVGATALIMVHNHPSGDPSPSRADLDLTNAVIAAAATFDIAVHDHIIISRNGYTSFRSEGLI
ncbi:MAG: hypothetical protein CL565_05170 [Alphaproteobacteria bacterium]|nr:hypothetical protein [Alphaproteobacteria bacterium]|tara:strand:+ start:133 stop:813 length:681 start_codon:yes stop_codon:yes gene_type:complete